MARNKIPPKKNIRNVRFEDPVEAAMDVRKSRGELKTFNNNEFNE
jgi:hypothetical protein